MERTVQMLLDIIMMIVDEIDNPELTEKVRDRAVETAYEVSKDAASTEPVPFAGSEFIRLQNRETHRWVNVSDEEIRCYVCDAKVWHVAADYPCGEEVPRREIR